MKAFYSHTSPKHLSAISKLVIMRQMANEGRTVDEIATALMMCKSAVRIKLASNGLKITDRKPLKKQLVEKKVKEKSTPVISNYIIERSKRWEYLRANHEQMYVEDMAVVLGRRNFSVADTLRRLGLKAKWRFQKVTHKNKVFPASRVQIVRPPAVYTNSPSPYGIADELHNRKLVIHEQPGELHR